MKILILLLALPLGSIGQTVHVKYERIVYEGKEKINSSSASEIFKRIHQTVPSLVSSYQVTEQSSNTIKADGKFKLNSDYNIVRTVSYNIQLKATEGGYSYVIDSVKFTERNRGEKETTKSSQEILKNMDEAGKIVGDTEKILNETDLRIQKLLELLKQQASKE
jgi:hypothetical protein